MPRLDERARQPLSPDELRRLLYAVDHGTPIAVLQKRFGRGSKVLYEAVAKARGIHREGSRSGRPGQR